MGGLLVVLRRINTWSSKICCDIVNHPNLSCAVPSLIFFPFESLEMSVTAFTPLHTLPIGSPEVLLPPMEQQNPFQSRDPKVIFAEYQFALAQMKMSSAREQSLFLELLAHTGSPEGERIIHTVFRGMEESTFTMPPPMLHPPVANMYPVLPPVAMLPPPPPPPPPPSQEVGSDPSQFFAALSQATGSLLLTQPLSEIPNSTPAGSWEFCQSLATYPEEFPSEFADFGFGDIMDLTSLDSPLSTSTAGSSSSSSGSGQSLELVNAVGESESDNSGLGEGMVQDPKPPLDSLPLSTSTTSSSGSDQPKLRLVIPAASIGEEEEMMQDLLESLGPLSPLTPLPSDDEY